MVIFPYFGENCLCILGHSPLGSDKFLYILQVFWGTKCSKQPSKKLNRKLIARLQGSPETIDSLISKVQAESEQRMMEVIKTFAESNKESIRSLTETLAESGKRTDERLAESGKRTDESLAESGKRTDEKIIKLTETLAETLAESGKRTDKSLAESGRRADEKITKSNNELSLKLKNLIGHNQNRDDSYESQMYEVLNNKFATGEVSIPGFNFFDGAISDKHREVITIKENKSENRSEYYFDKSNELNGTVFLKGFEWDGICVLQSRSNDSSIIYLQEIKTVVQQSDIEEIVKRIDTTRSFLRMIRDNAIPVECVKDGDTQNIRYRCQAWKSYINAELRAVLTFPDAPSSVLKASAKEANVFLLIRNGNDYSLV
jgi:hypothetical protein